MIRYCKKIDITDLDFIKSAIYECLDGKWRRNEVAEMLSRMNVLSIHDIRRAISLKQIEQLSECITRLAEYISYSIRRRRLDLPPITWTERLDGNSGKIRKIGTECILQQIYDYVAVNAIKDMCNAKIGYYQCACMPGRGQVFGKRAIEKWLKHDPKHTKYAIKADVKQCYNSIDHDVLLKFLHRDIKNDALLWLLEELIKTFGAGLSIGSYLSQYLCNYLLSYAYHYASERLAITKTRRGKEKRIRLIYHVLFYMDDVLLTGSNKRHLKQGFDMLSAFLRDELHLEFKDTWRLFRVQYIGSDNKPHGSIIDMMGYKITRTHTTVRRCIFLHTRRVITRAGKYITKHKNVPRRLCCAALSLFGWFKHCDSYHFIKMYGKICRRLRRIISNYDKERVKVCCK